MFDFSLAEIGLVVVVGVIFIGPDELPVVIRTISKTLRSVKGLANELRAAFDDLSKESGVKDMQDSFTHEMRLIQGDDGTMYESYHPVHTSNAPKKPVTPATPTITDIPDDK